MKIYSCCLKSEKNLFRHSGGTGLDCGGEIQMAAEQKLRGCRGQILRYFVLGILWESCTAQIRYTVPEEVEKGSFVGDIAKDLQLKPLELSEQGARMVSRGKTQHFILNSRKGNLVTADRIDREELCPGAPRCFLNLEILLEDKANIYGVEVEITDINDNKPYFRDEEVEVKISEIAAPGMRFPLPEAFDSDVGVNSVQSYQLSPNHHFSLHEQSGTDGVKYPELVLERALDREKDPVHHLTLTASDGGDPVRSGTGRVRVTVVDFNDNAPVFTQSEYRVSVPENVPVRTLLITVTATDPDEGVNGEVTYSFRKITERTSKIFQMNTVTGEISTTENLDFEESALYEMEVQAEDGPGLLGKAKVLVSVSDVNDNAPEVSITSLTKSVSEDSLPGTVIALLNVHDRDSGENGHVMCSISENLPLKLVKSYGNYYKLITAGTLDREEVSLYNVTVTATDQGTPPLFMNTYIPVHVVDTNDNPPTFGQTYYSAYIRENNPRGASIYSVVARDPDSEENGRVTYSIAEDILQGSPLSSFISINSDTGVLYALSSFDYEQLHDINLLVNAQDAGDPPLSSNASLTLFILDQNDNAPEILYPAFPTDGSTGVELAPLSAEAGYLVTKIVAVDGDTGQNAWLSYHLLKATEPDLFSVGLHTGEIRTARTFLRKDALKQNLIVAVTDNGEPPLSSTVSVIVAVADSIPEVLSDLNRLAVPEVLSEDSLTFYLVLALAAVSCLFFGFIIVLVVFRLCKWRASQLLRSGTSHFAVDPDSEFVGIDGVQAFLQTQIQEVTLTMGSQKSRLLFPQQSHADTLTCHTICEKNRPLSASQNILEGKEDSNIFQVLVHKDQEDQTHTLQDTEKGNLQTLYTPYLGSGHGSPGKHRSHELTTDSKVCISKRSNGP
ncbi:protocadherin gamma-A4-like isoform X21 [Macrotis lagotis]|uniref:protocadherin gamma-A4-like isoform X21 n=1 Tax=Macrotis lagotis TaxID=92651 RepID=UPI003D6879C8